MGNTTASSSINGKEIVSIRCGMFEQNGRHCLGRVVIVDYHGIIIYDSYVSQANPSATHLRSASSGIRRQDVFGAPSIDIVRNQVANILVDKIVIGHNLSYDAIPLGINNMLMYESRRDIATSPFILHEYRLLNRPTVDFKVVAAVILQRVIQTGRNDVIEEAKSIMDIYKKYQINIENEYSIEAAGELQQPNNNTLQDIVNVGGQYIGTIVLIGSLITPFIYK